MVSANVSRERIPLVESAKHYDTITSLIRASDPQVLGLSLSDVNERLLAGLSANLTTPLDVITRELNTVLQTVKDVGNDMNTVPTTTAREVRSMPGRLKTDTVITIPSRVKMLLANFENAFEDPTSLYPRLICCDLPVDPAKILNFAKKHHRLDQKLRQEGAGEDEDRSMPSAPKSAVDVITNVNASLESVSDLLCESVDNVTVISESFEGLQVAADNLISIAEPVNEAMNQHEEIRGIFDRIVSLLSHGHKDTTVGNDDAMHFVTNASSLIENLTTTHVSEDLVPRVQNVKGILSDFVKNLTVLLARAKQAVSNLVSTLRKFVSSLPRISRELRQFFVPTGYRALFMKPSPDLVSLLQSIDDMRTALPEPDTIERSSADLFGPECLANRVSSLLDKVSQLDIAQRKLFESIENQNLPVIISEIVQETLESILRDLRSSLANMLDLAGSSIDADDMAAKLRKLFALGGQEGERRKPGRKDQDPTGLVENIMGAGDLFGRLFET